MFRRRAISDVPYAPFPSSPYKAALLSIGMGAVASAAVGIVTTYNAAGIAPKANVFHNLVAWFGVPVPFFNPLLIIVVQLFMVMSYGLLTINFIWQRASAFDSNRNLLNIVLEGCLGVTMLTCVYAATTDILLFRLGTVLAWLVWTFRCILGALSTTNRYSEQFEASLLNYGVPFGAIIFVAGMLIFALLISGRPADPVFAKNIIAAILDFAFSFIPAGWAGYQLWVNREGFSRPLEAE